MKKEQNICIKCGMCCDGTLFPEAKINHKEAINPKYNFEIVTNEIIAFRLPCYYLNDKKCTIYLNRPYSVCDRFKCKLLKKHLAGDISYSEAVKIIELRNQLAEIISDFNSSNSPLYLSRTFVSFKEHQIEKLGELEFRKKYSQTILDHRVFKMSLKKWFYREKDLKATSLNIK